MSICYFRFIFCLPLFDCCSFLFRFLSYSVFSALNVLAIDWCAHYELLLILMPLLYCISKLISIEGAQCTFYYLLLSFFIFSRRMLSSYLLLMPFNIWLEGLSFCSCVLLFKLMSSVR